MEDDYQFDDLDTSATPSTTPPTPSATGGATAGGQSDHGYTSNSSNSSNQGDGNYATELFSKQIKAKFRTFYVDLKESNNGKFIKISEKSHGRKSTIMMDAEDVAIFIEALQEVQAHL